MIARMLLLIVLALCALGGAPQPGETTPPPEWVVARLRALAPSNPEAYFLLGEEVADVSPDRGQEGLARHLFVLAYELDRARGAGSRMGGSCCLALAGLERLDQNRRWLHAVAGSVDPRYARQDWSVPAAALATEEIAYKAATVLGLARSGDGLLARRVIAEPDVLPLLKAYERALSNTGGTGAVFRVQKYIDEWPCRTCENRRVVARSGPSGPEYRVCPACQGNPGPMISDDELLLHLRFEAALLHGIQRSWAAQLAVDQSAPLRDPDPEALAPTYGVDPRLAYWRDWVWVASADARPQPKPDAK